MSLADPGAANINDDSMRPVKVLDDWVLHGRGRRLSGFGVLDLEVGGLLAGVLGALESAVPYLSSEP
jgi:hypothetical protein